MTNPQANKPQAPEPLRGSPTRSPELMPYPDVQASVRRMDDAAERSAAVDINRPHTDLLADAPREKLENIQSPEGMYFHQQILLVLIELKKKNQSLDLASVAPENLTALALANGLQLTPGQTIALQKLAETNPRLNWKALTDEAEKATTGTLEKIGNFVRENPKGTIALLLGGAFALYFGPKIIKWIAKKGWEKAKKGVKDALTPSATTILGMLGIAGVGAYLGRDKLRDVLYTTFGIQLSDSEARDALDKIRRGEMPADLKSRIDQAKARGETGARAVAATVAGAAATTAGEAADEVADELEEEAEARVEEGKEEFFGRLGIDYVGDPELRKEYERYRDFISATNDDLDVPAYLFGQIGGGSYEALMTQSDSILDSLSGIVRRLSDSEYSEMTKEGQQLYSKTRVKDLIQFFRMMKGGGDTETFPEFKGKKINEVMAIVTDPANKGKYLDAEKVAEAHEQNESFHNAWDMITGKKEGYGLAEIVKDPEKRGAFLTELTEGGGVMVFDMATHGVLTLISHSGDIFTFTGETAYYWVDKLSDSLLESDNLLIEAAGAYLCAAKYTIAVGAPLMMTTGFLSAFARKPSVTLAAVGGMKGMAKGAKKGLMLPGQVLKALAYDIPTGSMRPGEALWHFMDDSVLHMVEDFRLNRFAAKLFGTRSFAERAAMGQFELTEGLMRRLDYYRSYFDDRAIEYERMAKHSLSKKGLYMEYATRYREARDEIDALHKRVGWGFDPSNPKRKIFRPSELMKNLAETELPEPVQRVLRQDKRLAMIFLNEKHPIAQAAKKLSPEAVGDLVTALIKDKALADELLRFPEMIHDPALTAVLRGRFDAADFKKIVETRLKVWETFTHRELLALQGDPRLVSRYAALKELIRADEAALENAKRGGETVGDLQESLKNRRRLAALLIKKDSAHGRFVAEHADQLGDLFKDTPDARRALRQLADIDPRILKAMEDSPELDVMENLARRLNRFNLDDELAIGATVAEYRKKIGLKGQAALGLADLRRSLKKPKLPMIDLPETPAEAAAEAKKWHDGFEGHAGPKFRVGDLATLAKMDSPEAVEAALKAKGMGEAAAKEAAATIARTNDTMEIEEALKKAATAHGDVVKFSPAVGRLAKIARFGGAALSVAGFGFSAWQMGSALYEAHETDNADRRNILLGKAGLYGASVLVDGAEVFLLGKSLVTGAAAAGAGAVGAAAFALAPITYMGEAALESMQERTKTVEEWRATDERQLLHEWISTQGLSAGDAYRVFTSATELGLEKGATREKIAAAVLLADEGAPAGAEPNPDRMHYLRVTSGFEPPVHYGAALDLLRDSRTYANIMTQRRQEMEQKKTDPGHTFTVGGLNVLDPRFENPGAKEIDTLLRAFQRHALEQIPEELKTNFDAFSDRYLIDLYCGGASALYHPETTDATRGEAVFIAQLETYLTYRRRINLPREVIRWQEEHRETVDVAGGRARLSMFQSNPSEALKEDLSRRTLTKGVMALAQLGKFFGYTGYPEEDSLKAFFDETHKDAFGVYWNGEAWFLNEAGYERDDEMGPTLDEATVRRMIDRMREQPDDVIGSRSDSVVDLVENDTFKAQVSAMALALEQGLAKELPQQQNLLPTEDTEPEDEVMDEAA